MKHWSIKNLTLIFFVFLLLLSFNPVILAAPVPVSPALTEGVAISASCRPTFSWAAEESAEGYEIAVFALENESPVTAEDIFSAFDATLSKIIPAPALSWTPGLSETGLQPGTTYIWYIRSQLDNEYGEWSVGARFSIDNSEILTTLNHSLEQKLETFSDITTDTGYSFDAESPLTSFATTIYDAIVREELSPVRSSDLPRMGEEGDAHRNVIYGDFAGDNLDTINLDGAGGAFYNAFFGYEAGRYTTSGDGNVYFGYQAGIYDGGDENTLVGYRTGRQLTPLSSATANTFIGFKSGQAITSGSYNTFNGHNSGFNNETGQCNTFSGHKSGYKNLATDNTFYGCNSGYNNTTGWCNVFIGRGAGQTNITGYNNTYIGFYAGLNSTGSGNIFIGNKAGQDETGANKLYIANSDTVSPLIYGEFDNALLRVNGTLELVTSFGASDQRWKKEIKPLPDALATVKELNGISYLWRYDEFPGKGFQKGRQIGLIAQEVEKVLPEVVNTDSQGYKSVAYSNIVPVLIEALKKQQEIIEKQGKAIAELQRIVKK